MGTKKYYEYLLKIQAIAKIGLLHSSDPYALINYQEINDLSKKMLEEFMEIDFNRPNYFQRDVYPTPNLSVRALVYNNEGHLLFVQEANSQKYSLPGGWVDLYQSPKEAILSEVSDEAGIGVEIERLIGVLDHTNFTSGTPEFVLVFLCRPNNYRQPHGHETLGADFFPIDKLPPLSHKMHPDELKRLLDAVIKNEVIYE